MSTFPLTTLCALCLSLSATISSAQAITPDPRVKPGNSFLIEFPGIGPSENAPVAKMGVWIPNDYTTDRKFPLLVWFHGGVGGSDTKLPRELVGDEGFICVGLPYQKELVWKSPWSFYAPMLRELEKVVPNINPRQRACAGYSSGGAAICHSIVAEDNGFRDYFYAFMPGGAGWVMGSFSPLKGRPIYAFMGSQDHTRVEAFRKIEGVAKSAGADITYLEYDAGHVLPKNHFPEMRKWLIEKMVLRDLPELRKTMHSAVAARQYGQAFQAAEQIRWVTPADSAEHAEALDIIGKVKPLGEQLAQRVLTAPLAAQQQFVREWRGCDFAEPVERKCAETAKAQLAQILSHNPVSSDFLKKYITMWQGFPAAGNAVVHYEKFAAEALEKVRSVSPDSAKNHALRQYIATWEPAPSTAEARRMREEIARAEFETITAIKAQGTVRSKLREFVRTYDGTEVAIEATRHMEQR